MKSKISDYDLIVLALAVACLWAMFGCATTPNPRPSTPEEVKIAVQTRVAHGLRDYPETEQYLIFAAVTLRGTATVSTNLAPESVAAHVDAEAIKHDWAGSSQVQARLILHDVMGWYHYSLTDDSANRRLLIAIADGINAARQTR